MPLHTERKGHIKVRGRPITIYGDSSQIRALAWEPKVPLEEGLAKTIAYCSSILSEA